MTAETDLQTFLDTHLAAMRPLAKGAATAHWLAETTGLHEHEAEEARLRTLLKKLYANREEYALLKRMQDSGEVRDPALKRQLKLLVLSYAGEQLDAATIEEVVKRETELQSIYNSYRALLRGERVSDNKLREVLRGSSDVALRKDAWEASKQIGAEVAPKVRELAKVRNRAARSLGFRDHYHMGLELQELHEPELLALLDALERETREPFRREKAALDASLAAQLGCRVDELRPWHYGDPFFQEAPKTGDVDLDGCYAGKDLEALTTKFYDGIGLDVRDIIARSDLYEREKKCQHAFCMHLDGDGDVRTLCNLKSNERWAGTMLHELGHAVYDKYFDPRAPYLLRGPAHTLTTEAIAMLMGRLSKNEGFLAEVVGVPRDEAARLGAAARAELRREQLIFCRWALVVTRFERGLFADPDADHDARWWELVRDIQMVTPPDGRHAPDWAAKIHIALIPVYYQNYVLGELTASQLEAKLSGRFGGIIGRPGAGDWLRERIFTPGARADWSDTIRAATGEPLSPKHFVAQFVT